MINKKIVQIILIAILLIPAMYLAGLIISILVPHPEIISKPASQQVAYVDRHGDQELAYLLVKLELKTRSVIGKHNARSQSLIPGVNFIYKRWLAKNAILPAAVADRVFSEVVPQATKGRAWVKMVVEKPRNPNNRGDSHALELFREIQNGVPNAELSTSGAYYYAEPIKATKACLPCHGATKGDPDPVFPKYQKDGWKEGEIVGAVVARVAKR